MASKKQTKPSEAAAPEVLGRVLKKADCVVFFEDTDSVIACGKSIMPWSRVGACMKRKTGGHLEPWVGFTLELPFPPDQAANEDSGHGVSFTIQSASQTVQENTHIVTVKFPRGTVYEYETASREFVNKFWSKERDVTILRAKLPQGEHVKVLGYGVPFADPNNPAVEAWYNHGQPGPDAHTLPDFLEQRMFKIAIGYTKDMVSRLFGPHALHETAHNPYLRDLVTDMDDFRAMMSNSGPAIAPIFFHDNYRTHLCAVQQGAVQDVLWLEDAANQLCKEKIHIRYVVPGDEVRAVYGAVYATVRLSDTFLVMYKSAWRRLLTAEAFKVAVFKSADDESPRRVLDCRVVSSGREYRNIRKTRGLGSRDLAAFAFDVGIREVTRQALTANVFHPDAEPTNDYAGTNSSKATEDEVSTWMLLHRCLIHGVGFFEWTKATGQVSTPTVNLLDFGDKVLADAIVKEALPEDQARFRAYLSNRALGCSLIIAAPGTGKTTASAAVVLAMNAKFGRILCSGPTNQTIDNYAQRINDVSLSVSQRCQTAASGADYRRRPVIMRGYKMRDELEAFKELLQCPENAGAELFGEFQKSAWKLPFSVTYWALVVLGSSAVDALSVNDSSALWELREEANCDCSWERLRDVASGARSWSDRRAESITNDDVLEFLAAVVDTADILCVSAAQLDTEPYKTWKKTKTRAVAVDEAGSMGRPDLYGVWGNTMLPVALSGDDRQFPALVLTKLETDANGSPINRYIGDGQLSQLRILQGMGMPVHRLKQQLRMANGMFDLMSSIKYPDVPLSYNSANCDVSLAMFSIGRDLEEFMGRQFKQLSAPPGGKLLPVFVHCETARSVIDDFTGSVSCPEQTHAALRLAARFVDETGADPARIRFLSPYTASVRTLKNYLDDYPQLEGTPPPTTVDSFQGHESDIVMLVTGIAGSRPGPEFIGDSARVTVMMTRQRCGLVIFGDRDVAGDLRGSFDQKVPITTAWGEKGSVKVPTLKRVIKGLVDMERSVTMTGKMLKDLKKRTA